MSRVSAARALATVLVLSSCDRGVVPASAPRSSPSPAIATPTKPPLLTPADVDRRLQAAWKAAGVTPTPPADDATWLRRAWLDVVGTIPPPEVTVRFIAQPPQAQADPTKRSRMIAELLASPLWADHWTAYWDDVLMGRDARRPDVDHGAFRSWLHDALARNTPYSEIVTELLTATGQNSSGGPKRASEENEGNDPPPANVNGAVNWTLRYQENPQDMAGAASRTLLGVQIQCAQCHDHKTEKWTQKDFQSFAAAFTRTRLVPIDPAPMKGSVKRVEVRDLDRPAPRFAKMGDLEPIAKAEPTALDGTRLGAGEGVRVALARWVTAPDNPWFARALVNRMWGHFLGRGFVDPIDDFRTSNPAIAPELLDALAADFVASGYDVKHLVCVIVGTDAYARSAAALDAATQKADPDAKLWERFRVAPLGPDELLDALVTATKLDAIVRATGRLDLAQVRSRVRERYGFLFDVDDVTDESDYEGTIAQALALLNGSVVATGASVLPGSALAEVLGTTGDDKMKIEALYVRALSRPPTPEEIASWTQFLADAQAEPEAAAAPPAAAPPERGKHEKPKKRGKAEQPDPLRNLEGRAGNLRATARVRAYEDLFWTLLNSSEFVLNH
ncbi:MAG: DUF1549 and DUF1553 domain-containing protein [Polyangiaceae bacterium]